MLTKAINVNELNCTIRRQIKPETKVQMYGTFKT